MLGFRPEPCSHADRKRGQPANRLPSRPCGRKWLLRTAPPGDRLSVRVVSEDTDPAGAGVAGPEEVAGQVARDVRSNRGGEERAGDVRRGADRARREVVRIVGAQDVEVRDGSSGRNGRSPGQLEAAGHLLDLEVGRLARDRPDGAVAVVAVVRADRHAVRVPVRLRGRQGGPAWIAAVVVLVVAELRRARVDRVVVVRAVAEGVEAVAVDVGRRAGTVRAAVDVRTVGLIVTVLVDAVDARPLDRGRGTAVRRAAAGVFTGLAGAVAAAAAAAALVGAVDRAVGAGLARPADAVVIAGVGDEGRDREGVSAPRPEVADRDVTRDRGRVGVEAVVVERPPAQGVGVLVDGVRGRGPGHGRGANRGRPVGAEEGLAAVVVDVVESRVGDGRGRRYPDGKRAGAALVGRVHQRVLVAVHPAAQRGGLGGEDEAGGPRLDHGRIGGLPGLDRELLALRRAGEADVVEAGSGRARDRDGPVRAVVALVLGQGVVVRDVLPFHE